MPECGLGAVGEGGMSFSFLASPYTGEKLEMNYRYRMAMRACAWLHGKGIIVFSPIVHWHETAIYYGLRKDADYWLNTNNAFLSASQDVIVLAIHDWIGSKGVQREINQALEQSKPLSYLYLYHETFRHSATPPVER
jgi:hypothetical protein